MDNPVVVTERELGLTKLDLPFDAMEQFLERLHVAQDDYLCLLNRPFLLMPLILPAPPQ